MAPEKTSARKPAPPAKGSKAVAVKTTPAVRTAPATWEHQIERFFDRLFDDFRRWPTLFGAARWPEAIAMRAPAVDVYDDKDAVVVKAELPGIDRDDIDISVGERTLTIKGEKKKEEEVKKADFYRWERSYGSFARTVDLPVAVEPDRATATFRDGVLEVRLPKGEHATPHRVPVKSA
jgi:HSP20 family protein